MSTEAPTAAEVEIRRYEQAGELLPGSAKHLAALWRTGLDGLGPEAMAETVARRLAAPYISRFRDPAHKPDPAQTELRRALGRRLDDLADGERTADTLAGEWAVDFAGKGPPAAARELARRLGLRDNNAHLKSKHAAPEGEARLADVLRDHFGDVLEPGHAPALAQYLYKTTNVRGLGDPRQLVRAVAVHLTMHGAGRWTRDGGRLPADDPRALPDDARGSYKMPARGDDGRYRPRPAAAAPAAPPRRRNVL